MAPLQMTFPEAVSKGSKTLVVDKSRVPVPVSLASFALSLSRVSGCLCLMTVGIRFSRADCRKKQVQKMVGWMDICWHHSTGTDKTILSWQISGSSLSWWLLVGFNLEEIRQHYSGVENAATSSLNANVNMILSVFVHDLLSSFQYFIFMNLEETHTVSPSFFRRVLFACYS